MVCQWHEAFRISNKLSALNESERLCKKLVSMQVFMVRVENGTPLNGVIF